jgi:hypothetical protein
MFKIIAVILAVSCPAVVLGADFGAAIPLQEGRLSASGWVRSMGQEVGISGGVLDCLPEGAAIDLRGAGDWLVVRGLNDALGEGWHVGVKNDWLTVVVNGSKLPHNWDEVCGAMARFTESASPEAAANQNRRWGLFLPANVNEKKSLVILIHGLDEDAGSCAAMQQLLDTDGWQTAVFSYPAERPIGQSAAMLGEYYAALRETFPNLRIEIVTQSMGALVARKYLEGNDYAGGVEKLIMIAPPNGGSKWAKYSLVEKISTNVWRWRHDAQWSPAWMINEGLCQSGRDLKPGSAFLRELNSHPRRAGVQYTIIAGDEPAGDRVAADALQGPADFLTNHFGDDRGVALASGVLRLWAWDWRDKTGRSDGPVAIKSALLAGVDDVVIVHADHLSLYQWIDGRAPVAWPIVKNRLEAPHGG